MEKLTLNVNGRDVVYDDPGKARAAARRWARMARELDTPGAPPEATLKMHELRSRAKAATDWARRAEDAATRSARNPAPPAADAEPPADDASSPSRRRAAAALAQSGVRRSRAAAATTRQRTGKARRRYERAGGVELASFSDLAVFFAGGVVLLALFENALSQRGSAGFAKATQVGTQIVHRIIAPVPIINPPAGG